MKNILILIICFAFAGVANGQSYKVIVNSGNSVSSLTKSEVSAYFLKKKTKWSTGDKVVPVDQSSKSDLRDDFSKAVVGKSVNAVKSYWQQAVFAGKGTPPVEKKTDQEVIDFVKNNKFAIGYISATVSDSGIKTITVN